MLNARAPKLARAAAALAVLAGLSSACEQRADNRSRPLPPRVEAQAPSTPSLLTAAALARGVDKLTDKAGKPLNVLKLTVYRDRIVLQAQDPKRHDVVNQYEFSRGKVSEPERVELRGSGSLDDNLFPLSEVELDNVPELAREAVAHVDPQNGEINYVLVKRNLPESMDIQMRVFVKSPVKDGYVDADNQGKMLKQ